MEIGDEAAMARAMAEVLAGQRRPADSGSWQQFEQETVIDQYLEVLCR